MTPEAIKPKKGLEIITSSVTSGVNLTEILSRHSKSGKQFKGSFDLVQVTGRGHHKYKDLGEPNHVSTLYMYGQEGFVINATSLSGSKAIVCAVSYDLDPLSHYDGVKDEDPRRYPRVLQMQGCTRPTGDAPVRRGIVMEALSTFYLEDVLLHIVTERAKRQGLPAIGILPAHANPQRVIEGYRMDKAELRFDGTAERMGFSKQGPDGLYVLELNAA